MYALVCTSLFKFEKCRFYRIYKGISKIFNLLFRDCLWINLNPATVLKFLYFNLAVTLTNGRTL